MIIEVKLWIFVAMIIALLAGSIYAGYLGDQIRKFKKEIKRLKKE